MNLNVQTSFADELAGSEESDVTSAPLVPKEELAVQNSVCRELGAGESEFISQEPNESPTHVARRYRITRDSENTNLYTAEVNLNFILTQSRAEQRYGHTGHDHPALFRAQNDEQRASFINRTRYCFESVDGKLRSPNGTQLRLRIGSHDSAVSPSHVQISNNEIRSNSQGWAGRIDCATIVHEVFHLLGLVDGYRETIKTVLPRTQAKYPALPEGVTPSRYMYDCRRIEPNTSVMHNQENALSNRYSIIFCPVSGDERPRGQKVDSVPVRCPNGNFPANSFANINRVAFDIKVRTYSRPAATTPVPKGRVSSTPYRGAHYFYSESGPVETPLTDEQMSFITKPSCLTESANYISCSQNAYRTRTLRGCVEAPGCD